MKMQMKLHCHSCGKDFREVANRKRLVHRVLESECPKCRIKPIQQAGKYTRINQ